MTVKEAFGQREITKEIEARRGLLQPSEVNQGHIPDWFRKRLMETYGYKQGLTSGTDVLRHSQVSNGWTWLDHRGSTTIWGKTVFVSEPYTITAESLLQVKDMCKRCGLRYRVDGSSWHYPGETIRILIFEPEEAEGSE